MAKKDMFLKGPCMYSDLEIQLPLINLNNLIIASVV